MGLDMYLNAKMFVSGYEFSGEEEQGRYRGIIEAAGATEIADKESPSATVSVTAAYWRKANAVHKWFVDNVQGGIDDCGDYELNADELMELRDLCQRVVNDPSKADDLLPSQSGFFFGSTDYDEWYMSDLKSTIEQIDRVLAAAKDGGWFFEYHSSW